MCRLHMRDRVCFVSFVSVCFVIPPLAYTVIKTVSVYRLKRAPYPSSHTYRVTQYYFIPILSRWS